MPDYGQDIRFGTFITPRAADPAGVVELAQASEDLGFELATFQDHPYQPRFLDTWTLLAWVAARTERIQLAPNVLNLPLRQPAVMARSAASLDLLSGGRLALGMGSGAFWDAISAMGAPRRTPGEAVTGLSDAIEIMRGLWDTGNRQPLRVDGAIYAVNGAKRGPAPAHPIPIWLGAYGPRMLRLTGRSADGWLPSLGYLKPGDLPRANAAIDAAATDAGRAPASIRRVLNIGGTFTDERGGLLQGPVEKWVEDLVNLAVDDGIDTFILATDDADVMRRFAGEVVPAVRDEVAARRRSDP